MATIRIATERDLDDVTRLSAWWASERITYGQARDSREQVRSQLTNYFYVATDDASAVVGYAYGSAHTSDESVSAVLPVGTRYLEVDAIYVRPPDRSRGLGTRLLDAILRHARTDGIERSLLFTGAKDLQQVIRFYGRQGFEPWGVQLVL